MQALANTLITVGSLTLSAFIINEVRSNFTHSDIIIKTNTQLTANHYETVLSNVIIFRNSQRRFLKMAYYNCLLFTKLTVQKIEDDFDILSSKNCYYLFRPFAIQIKNINGPDDLDLINTDSFLKFEVWV